MPAPIRLPHSRTNGRADHLTAPVVFRARRPLRGIDLGEHASDDELRTMQWAMGVLVILVCALSAAIAAGVLLLIWQLVARVLRAIGVGA